MESSTFARARRQAHSLTPRAAEVLQRRWPGYINSLQAARYLLVASIRPPTVVGPEKLSAYPRWRIGVVGFPPLSRTPKKITNNYWQKMRTQSPERSLVESHRRQVNRRETRECSFVARFLFGKALRSCSISRAL